VLPVATVTTHGAAIHKNAMAMHQLYLRAPSTPALSGKTRARPPPPDGSLDCMTAQVRANTSLVAVEVAVLVAVDVAVDVPVAVDVRVAVDVDVDVDVPVDVAVKSDGEVSSYSGSQTALTSVAMLILSVAAAPSTPGRTEIAAISR
jgi:hypothetical protein